MDFDTIISTELLSNHLDDPHWVIIDCRFDLADPNWGEQAYLQSHIPGAVYAHLDKDLAAKRTKESGRHPLPEVNAYRATCSRWGISTDTQVVAYDSLGGAYAARLWWLLNDYGHPSVALLDGGWQKWVAEGKPTRSGIETAISVNFFGTPGIMPIISTPEMIDEAQNGNRIIIDARSPERYAGLVEPIDPVAGHIPGAVNRFHGLNLDPQNIFRKPELLKYEYLTILGNSSPQDAVVYCGSGVTSCHHILAMKIAGLPLPRLYAGSWSEWIRDPDHPIASGKI